MLSKEFITEDFSKLSPEVELAKKLPSLRKHNYNTIDKLMTQIADRRKITGKKLHDLFVNKYGKIPDDWIKEKLNESETANVEEEINKFIDWASQKLKIESKPKFEFSRDTDIAQDGHHTGSHDPKSGKVWVYIKNRNLVDILRTVFHELVHVRQGELGLINPGDSYPGSPIESQADKLAGKYIKIYSEKNHHIFQ